MAKKVKQENQPLYINGKYVTKSTKPLHPVKFEKGQSPYELTDKKVRVTLVKSTIACLDDQQATVKALGFHKIGETREFALNDAISGMLFKVRHLVKVEEI